MTIQQATNSAFEARAEQKAAGQARPQVPDGRPSPGPGTPGPSISRVTHPTEEPPSARLPNSWTLRGIGMNNRIGYLWDTVLQEVKRA